MIKGVLSKNVFKRNKIIRFLVFCLKSFQTLLIIIRNWPLLTSLICEDSVTIVIRPKDPYEAFINQCLYQDDKGNLRLIGRLTNWRYEPRCDLIGNSIRRNWDVVKQPKSGIFELTLDFNLERVSFKELIASSFPPNFEDPRLLFLGSKLHLLLTEVSISTTGRLNSSVSLFDTQLMSIKKLEVSIAKSIEKNWVPIDLYQSELRLLYSAKPWVEITNLRESKDTITMQLRKCKDRSEEATNGGTAIVQLLDGRWMRIARQKRRLFLFGWIHLNYLMIYNSNFELTETFGPFIFRKLGFEVCNGIFLKGEKIHFSWTEDDETSFLAEIDLGGLKTKKSSQGFFRESSDLLRALRGKPLRNFAGAKELFL